MLRSITALLFALSAITIGGCADSNRPESDLVLLYTGNVNGYIEPCGCVAGQIGGIDRISGYIEREKQALGDRGLFIDTGDLFAEGVIDDANSRRQLEIKAAQFLKVWKHLGCDALAIGEAEVAVGVDAVKRLAADADLPILAGNIVTPDGERPFAESMIFNRGGMKIGVFSLIGGTMAQPIPKKGKAKLKRNDVVALLKEQGYELEPWRARARAIVAELEPQVDLIFCASHLGFNRNVQLAEVLPNIDLIFGGHYGKSEGQTTVVENVPILTTRLRGSRVGRFELWLDEPENYLSKHNDGQHGVLENDSAYEEAQISMEVSRQVYGELAGMERKYGSDGWQRKRAVQEHTYGLSFESLQAQVADPGGNRFSNNQIPMHHGIPRSDYALDAVDAYHDETHALWSDSESGHSPSKSLFVGPEACIRCHQEQYDFWRGTRHSRAFATLEATRQDTDAECIGCHTVGYGSAEGFMLPGQSDGFENVQCAACHGGGAKHISGGASFLIPDLIGNGMSGCARCHKDEHDPAFVSEGAAKLMKVACPKIGSNGSLNSNLKETYVRSAKTLSKLPKKDWALIAYAYGRAGELQLAVDSAKSGVLEKPNSLAARFELAERLLDNNQHELAAKQYDVTTRSSPDNPRGWTGLAWSLFPNDRPNSLLAAREAYALDPDNLVSARILSMGLMATGLKDEARRVLKKHIALHPRQESGLADLLEQIPRD